MLQEPTLQLSHGYSLLPTFLSLSSSHKLFSLHKQHQTPKLYWNLRQYPSQKRFNICACSIKKARVRRKVKSNEELCNDIREFVSSVGLPEGYVPSMKELSQHGRSDLANIVRRRGYKLIRKLLESSGEGDVTRLDGEKDVAEIENTNDVLEDNLSGQDEKVKNSVEDVTSSTAVANLEYFSCSPNPDADIKNSQYNNGPAESSANIFLNEDALHTVEQNGHMKNVCSHDLSFQAPIAESSLHISSNNSDVSSHDQSGSHVDFSSGLSHSEGTSDDSDDQDDTLETDRDDFLTAKVSVTDRVSSSTYAESAGVADHYTTSLESSDNPSLSADPAGIADNSTIPQESSVDPFIKEETDGDDLFTADVSVSDRVFSGQHADSAVIPDDSSVVQETSVDLSMEEGADGDDILSAEASVTESVPSSTYADPSVLSDDCSIPQEPSVSISMEEEEINGDDFLPAEVSVSESVSRSTYADPAVITDDISTPQESSINLSEEEGSDDLKVYEAEVKDDVEENFQATENSPEEHYCRPPDVTQEREPGDTSVKMKYPTDLTLEEKVANFLRNGNLDTFEDDAYGILDENAAEDSKPESGNVEEIQSRTSTEAYPEDALNGSNVHMTANSSTLPSKQVAADDTIDHHNHRDDHTLAEGQGGDVDLDAETSKKNNQGEVNRLKFMLHQKELELSRLKDQIEKEKVALAALQTKAEMEISKAQKLISEKDAELNAAEESLSGLKEVQVDYSGHGEIVELAGSFNGWHHRIKMDQHPNSVGVEPTELRKSKVWSTRLWLYPGTYEIKFIVDGQWMLDPQRESVTKGAISNNTLRVDR